MLGMMMRTLLLLLIFSLPLAGCGLKGPLYLPDHQNPKK
jgi:predicted small lipoprotein YifL